VTQETAMAQQQETSGEECRKQAVRPAARGPRPQKCWTRYQASANAIDEAVAVDLFYCPQPASNAHTA